MALDEARDATDSVSDHISDHNTLHADYNEWHTDRGIRYVATDGDDNNDGLSWASPKATIAAAQATAGTESVIYLGQGTFNIDSSIELADGQSIVGVSPHASLGTVLKATATLGTDPLLTNTTGNLTSGGLFNLRAEGTNDANGGVGLYISNAAVAEFWAIDRVNFTKFTSHGIHFDMESTEIAGNPLWFGFVNAVDNGAGGTGDGVRIERANKGVVHFSYLGGDDNAGSLLYLDILNTESLVTVETMKSERRTDGKHDDIVTVNNANGGALQIGAFRVFDNVSGGTNANAFIRNTGDTSLRFSVGHTFYTNIGSNDYAYGFDDGTTQITVANFTRRPWAYYPNIGHKTPGTYTPSNVTTTRTYDADASSVAELADVLGSLIADLQTLGMVD